MRRRRAFVEPPGVVEQRERVVGERAQRVVGAVEQEFRTAGDRAEFADQRLLLVSAAGAFTLNISCLVFQNRGAKSAKLILNTMLIGVDVYKRQSEVLGALIR